MALLVIFFWPSNLVLAQARNGTRPEQGFFSGERQRHKPGNKKAAVESAAGLVTPVIVD